MGNLRRERAVLISALGELPAFQPQRLWDLRLGVAHYLHPFLGVALNASACVFALTAGDSAGI